MKVFHWEKDDNGKWQRIAVLKQLRNETLDEYGKNQKVFDERSNEWDCCTEMGDLDAEEKQALDDEDSETTLLTDHGPPPSASNPSDVQVSSSTLPPVSGSQQSSSVPSDSADLSQLSSSDQVPLLLTNKSRSRFLSTGTKFTFGSVISILWIRCASGLRPRSVKSALGTTNKGFGIGNWLFQHGTDTQLCQNSTWALCTAIFLGYLSIAVGLSFQCPCLTWREAIHGASSSAGE